MRTCASGLNGRVFIRALLSAAVIAGGASMASAQTTVTLNQPTSQVVAATIRGGSYADTSDQWTLETRSADNLEYNRRALLKFDTENNIPAGSVVTSAILTVTVKRASEDASRTVGAYQTSLSWTEGEVTWKLRRAGQQWPTAGGDYGTKIDEAVVGDEGTKVTFDVTALVKAAVAGDLGSSRYTRIALIDLEESTSESYRAYVDSNDPNVAARPTLKVTYRSSTSTPPPPAPKPTPAPTPDPPPSTTATGTTLRVLHWNTHHGGVGSDGVWDPERLVSWIVKFNPDIISLNEMERFTGWSHNTDEPATIAALLKQKTGKTWYYKFQTLAGGAKGIGCEILSRFPFDAGEPRLLSGDRSAINGAITFNGRTINFTSTHLHPDSATYRKTEIGELTSWERGLAEQRIIAGDFNASYTSTENGLMKQTYVDSWAEAQADGTAQAYIGNAAGNTRNGRIDFIYVSRDATHLVLKSSQVYDTRDSKGVMPSDHKPLMSVFTVK
jgi:endonuclease/exonuclease/phosphatase family metal-dependent hydrolase